MRRMPTKDCLAVKAFRMGFGTHPHFVLECDLDNIDKCERNCRCIEHGKVCPKLSIERLAVQAVILATTLKGM